MRLAAPLGKDDRNVLATPRQRAVHKGGVIAPPPLLEHARETTTDERRPLRKAACRIAVMIRVRRHIVNGSLVLPPEGTPADLTRVKRMKRSATPLPSGPDIDRAGIDAEKLRLLLES